MCKNIKLISKTVNGRIYKCLRCNNIQIEYKNLSFSFSHKEYQSFKDYFLTIDGEYWENINKNTHHERKVLIPIGHRNVMIAMNSVEVHELKALFSGKKNGEKRFEIGHQGIFEKVLLN